MKVTMLIIQKVTILITKGLIVDKYVVTNN